MQAAIKQLGVHGRQVSPSERSGPDVHRPDLVRPIDGQAPQQIRMDRMFGVLAARVGLAVQRLNAHGAHQRRHMLAADRLALLPQQIAQHSRPANKCSRCSASIRRINARSAAEVGCGREYTAERDSSSNCVWRMIGKSCPPSNIALRSHRRCDRARRTKIIFQRQLPDLGVQSLEVRAVLPLLRGGREHLCRQLQQLGLPLCDVVRLDIEPFGQLYQRVVTLLTAASATLALNAAEWLRRGRLMLSAPFISGVTIAAKSRAVTYTPVQISGATSV